MALPVSTTRDDAGQLTSDLSRTAFTRAPVNSDVAVCADNDCVANNVNPSEAIAVAVLSPVGE